MKRTSKRDRKILRLAMTVRRIFIKRFETGADKELREVFKLKGKYRLKKRGRVIVFVLKLILRLRFVYYRLPKKWLLEPVRRRKKAAQRRRKLRKLRQQGAFDGCVFPGRFLVAPLAPPFP